MSMFNQYLNSKMDTSSLPIDLQKEIAREALTFYCALDVVEATQLPMDDPHGVFLRHNAMHVMPSAFEIDKLKVSKQVANLAVAMLTPFPHDREAVGRIVTYNTNKYVVVGTTSMVTPNSASWFALCIEANRRDSDLGDNLYFSLRDRNVEWTDEVYDFEYYVIQRKRDLVVESPLADESYDSWGDTYAYQSGFNFNA